VIAALTVLTTMATKTTQSNTSETSPTGASAPPAGNAGIILYYLENSRSQRILWLLEEMGTPYEVEIYKRRPDGLADSKLKDIHPLGKSPVIRANGRVLAESGFITEYLVNNFAPSLRPTGEQDLFDYGYYMHFAEGTMMTPLLVKLIFGMIVTGSPFFIRPISSRISASINDLYIMPNLSADFSMIESHLKTKAFFAGASLSGADIMMSFPLEMAVSRAGLTKRKYPAIHQWLERIHARPAYKRALEKGGGNYDILKK